MISRQRDWAKSRMEIGSNHSRVQTTLTPLILNPRIGAGLVWEMQVLHEHGEGVERPAQDEGAGQARVAGDDGLRARSP